MAGSVAQHGPCGTSGSGSMRVGRGESCLGLPAVGALTKADPSGGWRRFPLGRAGTTDWSASEPPAPGFPAIPGGVTVAPDAL